MNNSDDDFLNFDLWFSLYKQNLSQEIADLLEKNAETINILFLHKKIMAEMIPALIELMEDQFIGFKDDKRPLIRKEFEEIAQTVCFNIPLQVNKLIKDQNAGKKVRKIYPDFEEFEEIIQNENKIYLIEESEHENFKRFTEKQWIAFRDERNAEEMEMHKELTARKFAFFGVLQKILIKYLPEIFDLNRDELIVYQTILTTEYWDYRSRCYHIEHFIDYGLPESDLKLPYSEYKKKAEEINNQRRLKGQ
jgi:hypothetical protein